MISCEKDILDILKNIKVIAFDMDGVLRIGNNPISGAENIFQIIKELKIEKENKLKSLVTKINNKLKGYKITTKKEKELMFNEDSKKIVFEKKIINERCPYIEDVDKKLLLNKKELKKLEKEVKNTGLTIVPLKLFINDKGFAKLEIALAKGKKLFDKRETIKERDNKRTLDRVKKNFKS